MTQSTHNVSDQKIPRIIQDLGPDALASYQRFFQFSGLSENSRKVYRVNLQRFFRWAEARRAHLNTINSIDIATYRAECTERYSVHQASILLTPVRAFFHRMNAAGILANYPFGATDLSGHPRPPGKALPLTSSATHGTNNNTEDFRQLPLLSVMAMLANMEETSLQRVLTETTSATSLLEFIRWRNNRHCTHCGAIDETAAETQAEVQDFRCGTCGKAFRVTDGSVFEASPLPIERQLSMLYHLCISTEDSQPEENRILDSEVEPEWIVSFERSIRAWLESQGLSDRDTLQKAIAEKDRDLTQDENIRDIVRHAGLMDAREQLVRAIAEESSIDDLPEGITVADALEKIEAELAESDRYILFLEDGRIQKRLATPEELARLETATHTSISGSAE